MEVLTKCIQFTIGIPLILSIYKSRNIKWYVDALFSVHKDIMRHNDVFMNIITVGAYSQSIKQKLNTKIST